MNMRSQTFRTDGIDLNSSFCKELGVANPTWENRTPFGKCLISGWNYFPSKAWEAGSTQSVFGNLLLPRVLKEGSCSPPLPASVSAHDCLCVTTSEWSGGSRPALHSYCHLGR